MNTVRHDSACECHSCKVAYLADQKIKRAMAEADKQPIWPINVLRFPVERTRAKGEL